MTKGPPPLKPFGLVLCHDGVFLHEREPIRNKKLRAHLDRSVAYLPEEDKFIVRLGHFRGQIEVEEAGFFVRAFDAETGRICLSDGSEELLDVASLSESPMDGALLCRIKRSLRTEGLLARFSHSAHADLLHAAEPDGDAFALQIGGERHPLPIE